ncbi:MAG TPA: hypothetical protein VFG86_13140 [Chloroflexota bacterium]|jgi:hypothetical protein|nr:hypothetical protein [Chloroflexota bacterium]
MVTTSVEPAPPVAERRTGGESAQLRQRVIEMLDVVRVPTPRHLTQDLLACWQITVDMRQLSRLSRAEERAFQTAATDARHLPVPAISCLDLSAIPHTLTLSSWPLEQRIVGMYTTRTRLLRVLLRLLDQASLFEAERLQRMVARYAETVPGAMERGRAREAAKVISAAQAELDVLEPLDLTERLAAATRLAVLAPKFQLWGKPAVLTTSPTSVGNSVEAQP